MMHYALAEGVASTWVKGSDYEVLREIVMVSALFAMDCIQCLVTCGLQMGARQRTVYMLPGVHQV